MPWKNPYDGLAADEFADIHEAVMEAMGYVTTTIRIYEASPLAKDDLYGEGSDGDDGWTLYAEIGASVRVKPDEERLTRMGLKTDAEVLCFIPKGYVNLWETDNLSVFQPTEAMEVEVHGTRYNIHEVPDPDYLPVAVSGQDYIGMVITGWKEE